MQAPGGTARGDHRPLARRAGFLTALLVAAAYIAGGQATAGASPSPHYDGSSATGATSEWLLFVRPQVNGGDQLVTRGRGVGRSGGPMPGVPVTSVGIAFALLVLALRRPSWRGHATRWWAGRVQLRGPPPLGFA
jgi:hypothetical protein